MKKLPIPLRLLAGVFFPLALLAGGSNSGPASRTLLFVDDHDILYRAGTHRVFHPFQRHPGNPVIRGEEKPWEVAVAWMSVYRNPDTGRYQLWYQGYSGDKAKDRTRRSVVCYAESDDGVHFVKPNLGLFDFEGIKETNIVLLANPGSHDRYGASVVVNLQEKDAKRRYKMAHYDFTRGADGREYPGLNVAFSPDGIHWTKYPGGTLLRASYSDFDVPAPFEDEKAKRPWDNPLALSDAVDAIYDPPRNEYVIYGKLWVDGPDGGLVWKHVMGRSESSDFVHWSPPEVVLTPDDEDPAYVEFHTSPVFFYDDCYFSLLQILHRAEGGGVIDIELALSRNGLDWRRPFRKQLALPRGAPGKFDGGSIFTNASPVMLPDEMRFYYGAYSGGATGGDDYSFASGIGLATLPKDRFAGLRSDAKSDQPTLPRPLENVGQVTLQAIELTPETILTLNADASEGAVRVELLDERGYRVRGFSREDAVSIRGNSLRHAVRWRDRSLAQLPPGRYLLRIYLENAEVFALSAAKAGELR